MLVWILAAITAVLGIACIVLAVLYVKAEQEVRQRRSDAWDLKTVKMENANLTKECNIAVQAFTELDILHQKATKERDEWQGLYNELRDTYAAAQGDAHATVPLEVQEVPFTTNADGTFNVEAQPASQRAPAPTKRTRKKAETKQ